MKKKVIVIISILAIIIILLIVFKNKPNDNNVAENKIEKNDENVIEEIKSQVNATGNTSIYQVVEEYDGRQIIQVKPNVQFDTAFAGILKEGVPQDNEIENLLNSRPNKNGIWISKNSREKFLELLKENNIENYKINEDGYLMSQEENNSSENIQKLNNAIKSDKLYIIDINGTSYIRDDISGEIVEYPFEEMDPFQAVDVYQNESNIIIEITTNEMQKLAKEEILKVVLQNMEIY